MRIAFVVDPSPPPYRAGLVRQVGKLLREWGTRVSVLPANAGAVVDAPQHDLYVIAGEGDAAFAVAADVDASRRAVLNRYAALGALRQPASVARRLAAAEVPFALAESAPAAPPEGAARAVEITLEGVGGHVFGVAREGASRRDAPITLRPEFHRMALRCARALELDLFAIDLAVADGQPLVVAVRGFPALRAVPDAALRLADFVYASAERARAAAGAREAHASAPSGRHQEVVPAP